MTFDLDSFRRDGFQVVKGFFEPQMRERFRTLGLEIGAQVHAGQATRSQQFLGGIDVDAAAHVSDSPALHAAAKSVLGPDVAWLVSRVLMKDETFKTAIEAHQDWPYFGGDTRKLNVFVPLTSCRRENGMLIFYKGSHIMGPVERGPIDVDRFPQFEPVCPELEVGDVLFADFLTWHSSVNAETSDDRIMLQVVLQPLSDRSSNSVFGVGATDAGPLAEERFMPMQFAVPTISLSVANVFFDCGQFDNAFRLARGIAHAHPHDVEAWLLLAKIAKERGEDPSWFRTQAREAVEKLGEKLGYRMERSADPVPAFKSKIEQLTRELEDVRAAAARKRSPFSWLTDRGS